VGKVARGPESEGARGSVRRSRGRRAARQRKKLWRLDAAASGNLGARDEDNKKLWRCGAVGSGCQKTLMPGHRDVKKPWPEKAESVTKLWRPKLASSRIFDAWAPRCQRNLTPGVLRRHETLAPGKCAPPSRRRRPRMPHRIAPRKCIAEIFPLCIFRRSSHEPRNGPTAPTHTTALPRRVPPGSVPAGKGGGFERPRPESLAARLLGGRKILQALPSAP
jgi:hypothetical protein